MRILFTGATGFIGQALIPRLLEQGYQVTAWVRDPERGQKLLPKEVQLIDALGKWPEEQSLDVVINLAGAPIVDRRWTLARKEVLRSSRIGLTRELVRWLQERSLAPRLMLSGSAIGYYGMEYGDDPLDEAVAPGSDFAAELCRDWEAAAAAVIPLGTRLILLRTGLVLGPGGGVLKKMLPAFRLGLGGPIAGGQQLFSWITLEDYVAMVLFLLDVPDASGAYNATAPGAVAQAEFASALGSALNRPACLPTPALALQLALGEEAAELLIKGQRVVPQRLLEAGFEFRYPAVAEALDWALTAPVSGR